MAFVLFSGLSIIPQQTTLGDIIVRAVAALYEQKTFVIKKHNIEVVSMAESFLICTGGQPRKLRQADNNYNNYYITIMPVARDNSMSMAGDSSYANASP